MSFIDIVWPLHVRDFVDSEPCFLLCFQLCGKRYVAEELNQKPSKPPAIEKYGGLLCCAMFTSEIVILFQSAVIEPLREQISFLNAGPVKIWSASSISFSSSVIV